MVGSFSFKLNINEREIFSSLLNSGWKTIFYQTRYEYIHSYIHFQLKTTSFVIVILCMIYALWRLLNAVCYLSKNSSYVWLHG